MRRYAPLFLFVGLVIGWIPAAPAVSFAHGVIGKRFFPESVTVLDPFPADEMDLLAFSHQKETGALTNHLSGGISKRVSPNLSVALDWEYDRVRPNDGSPDTHGFNNISLDLKYAMLRLPDHEFLVASALEWEIGGTGAHQITDDAHSAVTPQILFGYGFGDLPDALQYLKPFAVAGQAGITTPAGPVRDTSSTIRYGLVIEYSFLYLQSFIKDIGIPWPFSRIVPIVEFAGTSPFNGPDTGRATAAAYPGLTWAGRYYQVTVEAILPMNDRTGSRPGVQGLLHLYLDDLFPHSYTRTPFYGVLGPTQR